MIDQYFLAVEVLAHPRDGNVFPPLRGVERPLWRGRAGLAEYAFDQPASQPRWTLPEATELMVTDQRVLYAHTRSDSPDTREVVSGELRWMWPQHLRVQPGAVQAGRSAATTQVQLVCAGSDGTFPALVFAGGDLQTVADADKLANLIRQAIARFRLDNAAKLGLSTAHSRLLSRLVIGPEFTNYQGGPGQTVSIQGALPVSRPAAASAPEPVPEPATESAAPVRGETGAHRAPVGEGPTRVITVRPGMAADHARAQLAAEAEAATQATEPELASRAADIAAQLADLMSRPAPDEEPARPARPAPEQDQARPSRPAPENEPARRPSPRHSDDGPTRRLNLSAGAEETTDLTERAEVVRRMAARVAANSGRHKTVTRRSTTAHIDGIR
jgi:hypothetical protein